MKVGEGTHQVFQVVCNFPVHADLVQGPGTVFIHPQHFALIRTGQSLFYISKYRRKTEGKQEQGQRMTMAVQQTMLETSVTRVGFWREELE